jgi:transposase
MSTSTSKLAEIHQPSRPSAPPPPRVRTADRQGLFRNFPLDDTLPADHRARLLVRLLDRLDLSAFYASIKAREHHPGRPAADPRLLFAVWVLALDQGVDSARKLDRLCKEHDAYRWILGGVSTNYHQLSDFRVQHASALREVFEQVLLKMSEEGLLSPERQAQDGTKVRASAGASSFHRRRSLRRSLQEARREAQRVKHHPVARTRRQRARQRACRERTQRTREAPKERARLELQGKSDARASTTDAEARVMKMADGGFRPAYNVEFSTTTKERVIVGIATTNVGSDRGQLQPMLEHLEASGRRPKEHLVDGGFVNFAAMEKAEEMGTRIYAPLPESHGAAEDRDDGDGIRQWRQRMQTEEGKKIYRERASTAELMAADMKSHGLILRVRGLTKVLQISCWAALAHNLRRWLSLLRSRFSGSQLQFLHSL